MTTTDWLLVAATFFGGGVIGTIISALALRRNQYYADVQHLRDLRADRVRGTFRRLLQVAGTQSDQVKERSAILQIGSPEIRRARLNEAIDRAAESYAEARIALRLEPTVYKKIDPLFDETQRAYNVFHATVDMPGFAWSNIEANAADMNAAVIALHEAMVDVLTRLDRASRPWYVLRGSSD